jgi:hypothetical protein
MFGSVLDIETNRYKKSLKRNVLWIVWFNENKNDQFVLLAYSLEKRKVSGIIYQIILSFQLTL